MKNTKNLYIAPTVAAFEFDDFDKMEGFPDSIAASGFSGQVLDF